MEKSKAQASDGEDQESDRQVMEKCETPRGVSDGEERERQTG